MTEIPAPHYTLNEAIGVCLAVCQRALMEVRALARIPGPAGPIGPAGMDGKNGTPGPKGDAGRNASDLTYLQDYIAEQIEKTFKTGKMITQDGGRTLQWILGDKIQEIKTAIVLDVGIWKDGTAYTKGDGVTFGGNFFIAQTETNSKPGASTDWRLAVRAGRDARGQRSEDAQIVKPVRFR